MDEPLEGLAPIIVEVLLQALQRLIREDSLAPILVEQHAKLALEVTNDALVLNRGRIVHEVLADFHQRVNQRLGRPASPLELPPDESDSLLAAALEGSLPPESSNPLQAALQEVDRRLVVEWLSKYREQLEKYDLQWSDFESPMAPELFEVSFGREGGAPPSTPQPLEFVRQDGMARVSGRIDRIDTGVVAGATV